MTVLSPRTILIVDDLPTNRRFLVTLLRDQGHRLLEAANGKEGLAIVQAEHPDLVITDVLMPVMDGYEFARQLRLDPASSRIPVLFYTAPYGEREARARAHSNGIPYVLTKPPEPEEVLRIVGRVLSGEPEPPAPPEASPPRNDAPRDHLRLLAEGLSEESGDLGDANARLRAVINIGLDLGSRQDSNRLLYSVCASAYDLFGASYVTLGIIDQVTGKVTRYAACGTDVDWINVGDAVLGMLGTVVGERRVMRGDNPGGDPALLQLPSLHPPVESFLAVPIASPTQVYGWICLVGNDGTSFSQEDEDLVVALSGQLGRILELEYEILGRQQVEAALREERDRAQQYLDIAEVILLALDLEGRITLVNRYACSILGWTVQELIGRNFIETCVPPRLRSETERKLRAVLAGPEVSVVDNAIITRSGEEHLIEWHNTLLRDDEGRVVSTLSSGTDITQRNQAVEALRTAEERMRFALQSASVGIWDQDFAAGVLRWSETLEAQYGLQPGTFGGTFEAFAERIHPDDRAAVLATVDQAMKQGTDFSVEHRAVLPDGTVRWMSGVGRVFLDDQGRPIRAVGISLDVTERHALEAQFQQAQKMEAVGRLAGGVAHDFNNLLTAILGYCELLLDGIDPADPRQGDIAEIQKAGLSAAGLTRQLLAFSRKEIIQPTLLDMNAVVGGMRAMLGRLIGEDVRIVLALRPHLASVKSDRGQLEQIVMNLAVNARDAMPRGGTLTIETANVELDENYPRTHLAVQPGPYVVLTVTDSGTGMSREVQARLFEPFFTTKAVGKGTGLGLATVHGIVTRSGGTVNVYSEAGRGTSIKVYLPRADVAAEVAEVPAAVALPAGGVQTVLVVEDEEGLRELTRRLLERQGYTVLTAEGADEAVRLFEENPSIDVLLTDVVMPGASGPELTLRLVEKSPGLKVIYMSGYTEDAIVHHEVLNPGIAFLHKPFTSESLGRKLREVLARPAEV